MIIENITAIIPMGIRIKRLYQVTLVLANLSLDMAAMINIKIVILISAIAYRWTGREFVDTMHGHRSFPFQDINDISTGCMSYEIIYFWMKTTSNIDRFFLHQIWRHISAWQDQAIFLRNRGQDDTKNSHFIQILCFNRMHCGSHSVIWERHDWRSASSIVIVTPSVTSNVNYITLKTSYVKNCYICYEC